MEFVINNWYIILAAMAVGAAFGISLYVFLKMPTEEQLRNVREWLVGAVTLAEKELGSGTGQLKLRQVYDQFLARFPWLAKVITFARFAKLVDDALEIMREMLKQNKAVKEYVEGANEDE